MSNESENNGGDDFYENEVGDRPQGPRPDVLLPPLPHHLAQHLLPPPQDNKNAHQQQYSSTGRDVQQQESDVEAQQQKEGEPPHKKNKKKKKKKRSSDKEMLQSKEGDKHNSSSMTSHQQKDPSGRILVLTNEEKRLSKDADRSSGREGAGDLNYYKKEPKIDEEVAGLMAAQHLHEDVPRKHSEVSEEKDTEGINEHEWEDDEIPYDSFSMLYVAENWKESVMPL